LPRFSRTSRQSGTLAWTGDPSNFRRIAQTVVDLNRFIHVFPIALVTFKVAHVVKTEKLAQLGDNVQVPTLEGAYKRVTLPPGTKQGSTFLLKGLGVPVVHKSERGDQLIIVKEIIVPTNITAEQEYLIRELSRLEHEQDEQHEKHFFLAFFEKIKDVFLQ
jgi:DnaJ-class molecular chaperone